MNLPRHRQLADFWNDGSHRKALAACIAFVFFAVSSYAQNSPRATQQPDKPDPTRDKEVADLISRLSNTRWQSTIAKKAVVRALAELNDPRAVDALTQFLNDSDPEVRTLALQMISESQKPPTSVATKLLKDKDDKVRADAAINLGFNGDRQAVPALVEALKDASAQVRVNAIRSLQMLDPSVLPKHLEKLLKDESVQVRRVAAETLALLATAETMTALLDSAGDPDEHVRKHVARALARFKDEKAAKKLSQLAEDASPLVRAAATSSLARHPGKGSIDALVVALGDPNPEVAKSAANSLSLLDAKDAIPALLDALKDWRGEVKVAAVQALVRLKATDHLDDIISLLKDDEMRVRRAAVEAVARLGSPERVVSALSESVSDRDRSVRILVLRTLSAFKGSKDALNAVGKTLKDIDAGVRKQAVLSIISIGGDGAADLLKQAANDSDAQVSAEAKKGVEQLSKPSPAPPADKKP